MKVVPLQAAPGKAESLAALDIVRAQIESGEIVGFVGASISSGDEVRGFCGAVGHVSRLRLMGAASHLLACMHAGEF